MWKLMIKRDDNWWGVAEFPAVRTLREAKAQHDEAQRRVPNAILKVKWIGEKR